MATEHTAVGVRRKVKLLVPISGRPVVVSWSDFTVALSQAVRVRLALQTARSRTRESVRCTKSPRPTVLEESDGSVLESGRYETATSHESIYHSHTRQSIQLKCTRCMLEHVC